MQVERIVLGSGEWDKALVCVAWSGVRYAVLPDGSAMRGAPNGVTRTLMLLVRRSDALTNVEQAILSAHCPSCGAPQEKLTDVRCQSCGRVMNDGSQWLLEKAENAGGRGEKELRKRLVTQTGPIPVEEAASDVVVSESPGGMEALAWSLMVARADGQVGLAEASAAYAAGRKWGVRKERVAQLLEAAESGTLDVLKPRNRDEARRWLDTMAETALADGRVTLAEERMMLAVAEEAGMSEIDVKMVLKRVSGRLASGNM